MADQDDAPPSFVRVERKVGYHIVWMSRPEKRNAMNKAARRALIAAFEDAASGGAKVVILTGVEGSFCSGTDVVEKRNDQTAGIAAEPQSEWIEVVMAIREHPAIFIAAVNGGAMGGGAALIDVCDLAFASEDAWISNPELGFGAFPHFSGPAAQYQMARKHAAWMVYTTERIDGATAAAWGLVNACVPAEALMPRAEALAAKIGGFDGVALAETKRALDATLGLERDWRSAFERGMQVNQTIKARSTKSQLGSAVAGLSRSPRRAVGTEPET